MKTDLEWAVKSESNFNDFIQQAGWIHEPFGTGHVDISCGLDLLRIRIQGLLEKINRLEAQLDKAYKDLASKDASILEALVQERVNKVLNENKKD